VFLLRTGRTRAPDLVPIDWAGEAEPVLVSGGRTRLIDFFSYGDPSGVHAFPLLRDLADHYRAHGLSILGVHVPAYEFERPLETARREIWRRGIAYPVALDHGWEIFRAYGLRDLPARVLVDGAGFVRGWEEGPGNFDLLERALRSLLREATPNAVLPEPLVREDRHGRPGRLRWRPSPEIRFGQKGIGFGPPDAQDAAEGTTRDFGELPDLRAEGIAYLRGRWRLGAERIVAEDRAEAAVVFEGSSVSAVLSVPDADIGAVEVEARLDGAPPAAEVAGSDLDRSEEGGPAVILCDRGGVYELISARDFGIHHLELGVRGRGLAIHLLHFGTTVVPDVA
jgi:hypothetical protein